MPLHDLLGTTSRFLLFAGKGGVGKTTCACAAAVAFARSGRRTLVFSTDPAHSLSDSLGAPIGGQVTSLPHLGLDALELDAQEILADFRRSYGDQILDLLTSATLLDEEDASRLLALSLPGIDEIMGLKRVTDFIDAGPSYDHYVWDSAPTGHTLRLLALPELLDDWVKALASLRWKYRYVSRRLAGVDYAGPADDFLFVLKQTIRRVSATLRDPHQCGVIVVTIPEAMALVETGRLLAALRSYGIVPWRLVINQVVPANPGCRHCAARRSAQEPHLRRVAREWPDLATIRVPEMSDEVRGVEALERLAAATC